MPIIWNVKRMTTGLSDLDEQHKQLLRIADDFDCALAQRQGVARLREALDRMRTYAETHFRLEEDYMAQYHCPVAEANHAAHERFRQMCDRLSRQIQSHGATMADAVELDLALSRWITEHICAIDSKLRSAVQKRAEELSRPPEP